MPFSALKSKRHILNSFWLETFNPAKMKIFNQGLQVAGKFMVYGLKFIVILFGMSD